MGKLQVIVGGQFGSEAKGSLAAWLARQSLAEHELPYMGIRVGGSNAGHTVYDDKGVEWKFRHVPVVSVINPDATLALAAGSEVDFSVLEQEIHLLEKAGYQISNRIVIDGTATMVTQDHYDAEANMSMTAKVGSTGKGVGAARADRLMRRAPVVQGGVRVDEMARGVLRSSGTVQIEGTQGYGLGLHAGYYPYCTSGDCRAIDFLAQAGLSPWAPEVDEFEVWMAIRVYPIRVAGNSGPLKGEKSWRELGLPEERTTVTNKVRRVGGWDPELVRNAIDANGGPHRVNLAVFMLDQIFPQVKGMTEAQYDETVWCWIKDREEELGCPIQVVGTSPTSMIDLRWRHS